MSSSQLDRRQFLQLAAAATTSVMLPRFAFAAQHFSMVRFPEKSEMIFLTDSPPQLETPLKSFLHDLTPNDQFFVRWHESGIPTSIDTRTFLLKLSGHVSNPISLSVDDLKTKFKPVSYAAVCQCSGNSRSLFEPRVAGGQWGHGAMSNAKWTGIPLRDLLSYAGIKDGAVDISFQGLDRPPLPDTPAFIKSLPASRCQDPDIIVAYAMNDADLPMLNGFPIRLIVPGWYATYWVKSLSQITVLNEKFKNFWMDKAYRIPNNPLANETPDKLATDTVPINAFAVHSIFVAPTETTQLSAGKPIEIQGLATDAGHTITRVEVSTDAGRSWSDAKLDPDLGKYSWRRWRFNWTPAAGVHRLMCRAANSIGQTQVVYQWNRSGYQRNVIEHLDVTVS